jgi:hypothetical protein
MFRVVIMLALLSLPAAALDNGQLENQSASL